MLFFLTCFSKIIIAAIKDEGEGAMTPETYDVLSKLSGTAVSNIDFRGSFAMIGFSGDDKPSFVKQVSDPLLF